MAARHNMALAASVGMAIAPCPADEFEEADLLGGIFQAVGLFQVESCPTPAVLPLVGLAAEKVIRERYN